MKRYDEFDQKDVFVNLILRILRTKKLCKDTSKIIVIEFLGYDTFLSLIKLVVDDLKVEQSIMSTLMLFLRELNNSREPHIKFVKPSSNLVNAFNKLQETKVYRVTHPKLHDCVEFLTTTTSDLFAGNTSSNTKLVDVLLKFSIGKEYICEKNLEWCTNLDKILSNMFKANGTITLPPYLRSMSMVKIIEDILHKYFGFSVSYIPRHRMYSTVFMLSPEYKGKKLSFSDRRLYSLDSIKSLLKSNRTCKI
jgi:hypothetical protein